MSGQISDSTNFEVVVSERNVPERCFGDVRRRLPAYRLCDLVVELDYRLAIQSNLGVFRKHLEQKWGTTMAGVSRNCIPRIVERVELPMRKYWRCEKKNEKDGSFGNPSYLFRIDDGAVAHECSPQRVVSHAQIGLVKFPLPTFREGCGVRPVASHSSPQRFL